MDLHALHVKTCVTRKVKGSEFKIMLAQKISFAYNVNMNLQRAENRIFSGLSNRVIGCAIEVHRHLGPGLLEATYQQCLAHELDLSGIKFKIEHPLPVDYKGVHLDCGYRLDFLIEDQIILELKSLEQLKSVHEAQLLTYLKLSGVRQGYLINFNVTRLKDGLHSFVM